MENIISVVLFSQINKILFVAEAKAKVLGPADLYVKTGSLLSLTCILSQGPHDLGTIFWYKGKYLLFYTEVFEIEVFTNKYSNEMSPNVIISVQEISFDKPIFYVSHH